MWENGRSMYDDYDDEYRYIWRDGKWVLRDTPEKKEEKKEPLGQLEKPKMIENATEYVRKEIADNLILVEPYPYIKMMQLMGIAGKVEIAGNLLVELENGIPVVKDLYLMEQDVTGGSWDTSEEQHGRFMWEIMFKDGDPKEVDGKPTGERLPVDEANYITQRLLGHFHSHNSLHENGKPSPSGIDDGDVADWRVGRPYWVEIIGTLGGFSGRIAFSQPRVTVTAEVKLKWWTGIQKVMDEATGKINLKYQTRKKEEKAPDGTTPTDNKTDNKIDKIEHKKKTTNGVQKNKYNAMPQTYNQSKMRDDWKPAVAVKYTGDLMAPKGLLTSEQEKEIVTIFEGALKKSEELRILINNDQSYDYVIYRDDKLISFMSERLMRIDKEKIWDIVDALDLDMDLNYIGKNQMGDHPRPTTYEGAMQLFKRETTTPEQTMEPTSPETINEEDKVVTKEIMNASEMATQMEVQKMLEKIGKGEF